MKEEREREREREREKMERGNEGEKWPRFIRSNCDYFVFIIGV